MNTYNEHPNFSILLPGECNADCNFCYNKYIKKISPVDLGEYLVKLIYILQSLPLQFHQIGLTGGEPLMSPYLASVLSVIKQYKSKYNNIVLTTNGTNLILKIEQIACVVDHINISRHHWDQNKNAAIFGGAYKLFDNHILQIIEDYSKKGIDITANCVINDDTDRKFIINFIKWAKTLGFYAVAFRKESGTLDKTPVENEFSEYKRISHNECPVCRQDMQLINGMTVYWKSSLSEPSDKIKDTIFEAIYQPNGLLYADWGCQKEIPVINNIKESLNDIIKKQQNNTNVNIINGEPTISPKHYGCGRSSEGGC